MIAYNKLLPNLISSHDPAQLLDAFSLIRELEREGSSTVVGGGEHGRDSVRFDDTNFSLAHDYNKQIRKEANALLKSNKSPSDMLDLYYKTHLFDAPYNFDSFCLYIEKDREPKKRFYLPRRKQLLRCVQAIQDMEDGKLHTVGISLAPGVGKTTLAEFGLAWTMGRHPFLPNLIGSHNAAFLGGMYGEMLRIVDSRGEYRWSDVYPGLKVIATNAKDLMIGIGYEKSDDARFKTLQFGSLQSQLAGRVRAANWMYLDDAVDGIETALNKDRLDKLWQTVYTDFFQRSIGDQVKRLMIGTRWSLLDPLGRMEDYYADDPGALFIREPVLDENDESRFDYPYGLGYTTEFLHTQRDLMDEPSWLAIYQQEPIERDGTLFDPSELQYFTDLPEAEPDAIIAVCDTKEQGSDYCAMPVLYQYGDTFYINSFICDNGKVELVQERVAQRLVDERVKLCQIESNRGGTLFANTVRDKVKEKGGFTSISTKWTQSNKETRIQTNSAWAKSHFLFRDPTDPSTSKEYRTAMTQLCTYSMIGKVKHDDVADVIALTVDYILNRAGQRVQILKRPF